MPATASAYPPIESLAFLSDGTVAALVGPDGNVEWLCPPRFDAPSVFGAILDRGAGTFRLAPTDSAATATRSYLPDSLVLETSWQTADGVVLVRDALLVGAEGASEGVLLRLLRCESGQVEVELDCQPAFDYGRMSADWRRAEDGSDGCVAAAGGLRLDLSGDVAFTLSGARALSRVRLVAGDARFVALGWNSGRPGPADAAAAELALQATVRHWREWLAGGTIPDGPWQPMLARSALTLKGLVFEPTGAPIAAATTSLPETPGGSRNWDYRYTWLRDGVFTLAALQDLGFKGEARRFIDFVCGGLAGGHELQVMYGIGGERELPESTLDHLAGYEGARPVRIGNGAVGQRQHDVWGVLLYLVERDVAAGGSIAVDRWPLLVAQVEAAMRHWREPDRGIWEVRGEPRHFTSSKLMAWVALDRGARLARWVGDLVIAERWAGEAATVHADICAHGLDARGVYTQTYGESGLDASMLLMPAMGFLPPTDERLRRTVLAVADELTEDGLVLRYRTESTDDGLSGEEGSFTICSFWLVSALARIGETARARALFERLLGMASPLGLYAEEIEPASGRHLGNMPQAFSHLALIGAALDLLAAE